MDLKSLLKAPEQEITSQVEFKEGIVLTMRYIPRTKLQDFATKSRIFKYDSATKTRNQTIDGDLFSEMFCEAAVVGWKGVTPESLSSVVPLNTEGFTDVELKTEIAFTKESLMILVKQAYEFDEFVQKVSTDLSYFKPHHEEELKN
jgi:hypothetical protein